MKQVRKEYLVRRNGYYLQETDKEGMYLQVNDINKASTFPTIENTISYIENDLCLNVANVAIIELRTTIETTPLVLVDDEFLPINEIGYCANCGKPFKLMDMQYFQIDDVSLAQLYCEKHFNELDEKWNNSFHGNQDSDVVDEVAEHYAKINKYYDDKVKEVK